MPEEAETGEGGHGLTRSRVTQKGIADALGLSLITVQRALNNSGYVSAEVRARIDAYVRKVGYVPHKASQVLKRNRTRRLALFSSTEPAYFWDDIHTGIEMAAEHIRLSDYQVSFCQFPENDAGAFLDELARCLREGTDGVGFANKWLRAVPKASAMLAQAGIPFVTFNVDAPDSGRACYIGADDRAGGRLAADYFAKVLYFREQPRILVFTTEPMDAGAEPETVDINNIRLEGFLALMHRRLPAAAVRVQTIPRSFETKEAAAALEAALRGGSEAPDGVYLVAACNPAFIQVLERLDLEKTYSVLHDLDKTSLHYLEAHPLMAVICQNPILQGYDAVRSLEQLLETGNVPCDRVEVVHSLVLDANKAHFSNARLATGDSSFDGR